MSRKQLYSLPACFYLGFMEGMDAARLIPFALVFLCALFPKKTFWIIVIGGPLSLYLAHLTGVLSLSFAVALGFVCLILFQMKKGEERPKVLLYFCLAWLFLLTMLAGPYAIGGCSCFLLWLSYVLKRPWILLLIALVLLPVSPLSLSSAAGVGERGLQSVSETVDAESSRQEEGEQSLRPSAGKQQEVVTEWVMNNAMPIALTRFFQWVFVGVGILFVLATVKLWREYGKGLLALAKKTGIAMIVLGSVLMLAYALARIPPNTEPFRAEGSGFFEEMARIERYLGPSETTGAMEAETEVIVRTVEVSMTLVNILVITATLSLLSLFLVRYLTRKPIKKEIEKDKKTSVVETRETEVLDSNLTGSELVKRVYRWIRAKRYPAHRMLTPYELLAAHPSENLRRITDAFVRAEYGFSEVKLSDEEIRRLFYEEIDRVPR
ncbi:MAG: hypothetical protein PHT42_01595 [Thermotogota bacterium]|nr:hypothetical protein [Thermotogota bacterium]